MSATKVLSPLHPKSQNAHGVSILCTSVISVSNTGSKMYPFFTPGETSRKRYNHLPEVMDFIIAKSKYQAFKHFFTPNSEFYLIDASAKEKKNLVFQFFYAKLHFSISSDVWPKFCFSGSCSKLISLVNQPLISYDHRLSLDRSSRTWSLKNDIIILKRNEGN